MYNEWVKVLFWLMGAVAIVGIVLLGWIIVVQGRHSPRTETRANIEYLKNVWKRELDPKAGSPLPGVTPSSIHLPSVNSTDRVLVIAIGSCESCTSKTFDAEWLNGSGAARVVALYLGDPPKKLEPLAPPFTDRVFLSGANFEKLNALWPRIFVLDSEGKLIAAQTPDDSEEAFVHKWIK